MKAIVQHFCATTKEWQEAGNPVLYKGVWGFEETEDRQVIAKVGDGKTSWESLKGFDINGLSEEIKELYATIGKRINEEAHLRSESYSYLYNQIDKEKLERQKVDTDLLGHISEESRDRQKGDNGLLTEINVLNRQISENISRVISLEDEHNKDENAHGGIKQEITNEINERKDADFNIKSTLDFVAETQERQGVFQQVDQSKPLTLFGSGGDVVGGSDPLGKSFTVYLQSFNVPYRNISINDFVIVTYRHETEGDILCFAKVASYNPKTRTCYFEIMSRLPNSQREINALRDQLRAEMETADTGLEDNINEIKELIPNQSNHANQLADKDFVNSSISNMASNYVTPNVAGDEQFISLDALRIGPWFHGGVPYSPTQNDYAIYINNDGFIWRAAFNGQLWSPTYKINDTPFTSNQLAAINSNITQALVDKITAPDSELAQNSEGFVKSGGIFAWFGAAVSTLKTTAKTVVGAINELFDTKANNTQSSITTGSGTDTSTSAQTNPTVWGMIQSIWNRLFALNTNVGTKANTASPGLTGTPTAPTAAVGTNTTQIATTAFVQSAKIASLKEENANNTLPSVTVNQTIQSLLQTMRNSLRWLIDEIKISVSELSTTQNKTDFVNETYLSRSIPYQWYRMYKNGWIEQGGCLYLNTIGGIYTGTITLPKRMYDNCYTISITCAANTTASGNVPVPVIVVPANATSEGFSYQTLNYLGITSSIYKTYLHWRVVGRRFYNSGEYSDY